MFEAFWQGRLIPGARVDSLPFIEVNVMAHTSLFVKCFPTALNCTAWGTPWQAYETAHLLAKHLPASQLLHLHHCHHVV